MWETVSMEINKAACSEQVLSSTDVRSLVATISVIVNVKNSECNIEASFNIKIVQIVFFLNKRK